MDEPLISVIVPVYNAEKFLAKCAESILKQTYSNLELLLIDDGSTDESGTICEYYNRIDKRVRVIHRTNGGVSSARNAGLDHLSGEYVMFVDADDCITTDCLEALMKGIDDYHADIVSALTIGDAFPWRSKDDYELWEGKKGIEESLKDNPFTYSAWAKLYRMELIGKTRFCENYRINEDSFFVFELLCKEPRFVVLNKSVYMYRNNPNGASKEAFSDKFYDILCVAHHKYRIVEEQHSELVGLAENMKLKAQMNMLRLLVTRTHGQYYQMEKSLEKEIIRNKRYYRAGIAADDRFMFIIRHHLLKAYSFLKRANN